MKNHILTILILGAFLGPLSRPLPAQNTLDPTVTLHATDPHAGESGADTGTFTVRRTGSTNFPLTVFYQLSGTASNGVDYEQLGNSVQIPVGAADASFTVKPLADLLTEGSETVVAQLTGSPLLCITCGYRIGVPSNAVVVIDDAGGPPHTNQPPEVRLNAPQNGDVFIAPATIALRAYAQDDEDGNNLTVEFFEGSNRLGTGVFVPTLCPAPYCPFYALEWSNVPPGNYTLTARATDSGGASALSDAVHVTVFGGVNIYATDPDGSENHSAPNVDPPSDPAVFTVRRFGETDEGIVVYYEISGTASNGVDYVRLPGQVTLPAGVASAEIVVQPFTDNLVEGTETVVVTLLAPCPQCLFAHPMCEVPQGTNCYPIGPNNRAVAYIHDGGTNVPPDTNVSVVTLLAPDPIAVEGPFCRSNWWWTTAWNGSNWNVAPAPGDPNLPGWRTNDCSGSNTATFSVRRSGPTNAELTVYYSVRGTASNGIDYLTIPGRATIPPGHRAARIEVIPIEDSLPEHIETVLLELQAPPPGTPAYITGIPRRAAAILIDNDQPRPPCMRLPDGLFHVCHPGTNGHNFSLRASPDLVTWTVLCTNTVTEGAVHFVDPDTTTLDRRFYQIVPEPSYTPPD